MSAGERAVNIALRVQGADEATAAFRSVGESGKAAVQSIAEATKAQAAFESANVRAQTATSAYAQAKAEATKATKEAADALKAETITQQQYDAAVAKTSATLALARAEQQASAKQLSTTAASVVAVRDAANGLEPALGRTGASSGMMRMQMMEAQHVVRSFMDSLAAGQSPLRAFSMEAGRMGEVVALSGGGMGKFGEFMSGPWGLAVTGATAVLLPLVAQVLAHKDAIQEDINKLEKDAKETENARIAKELFGKTLDGVTAAIRASRAALDDHDKSLKTENERTLDAINYQVAYGKAYIATTSAILARAQAEERAAQNSAGTATGALANAGALGLGEGTVPFTRQAQKVDALEAELKRASAALGEVLAQLPRAQANVSVEAGMKAGDPRQAIEDRYKRLIDAARQRAIVENNVGAALERQVATLEKAKKAELDALTVHHTKTPPEMGQFEMPVTGPITGRVGDQRPGHIHAGVDIAVPVGTSVKAPAAGVVIEAGTLGGYGNVIFIDHGAGTITRLAHLSQLDVKKGDAVAQGEVIGLSGGARGAAGAGDSTGPHLHYEVRVNGRPVDPRKGSFPVDSMGEAAKAEAAAERLAKQEATQAKNYADGKAQIDDQMLQVKRANLTDITAIATIEREQVKVASDKYNADLDAKVAHGEMTKAAADELKVSHAILSLAKDRQIDEDARRKLARDELQLEQGLHDNQRELLNAQLELAKTAEERRQIQQQLLALDKRDERARLNNVINDPKASASDKRIASDRASGLDTVYGARSQSINLAEGGPLAQYLDQTDPKRNGERVQGYVVDELKSIQQGIDDAVSSALGVQDPLLKSLIDMFIEQVLIRPIAEALQSHMGAGGVGGGFLGQLLGFGASLAGGGGLALGGTLGAAGATAGSLGGSVASLAAFASGTDDLPMGKPFWVGENGREKMIRMPGGRLQVLSNQQAHGAVDSGGPTIIQHNSFHIPERRDPRLPDAAVYRSMQLRGADAIRKGLAAPGRV